MTYVWDACEFSYYFYFACFEVVFDEMVYVGCFGCKVEI